MAHGGTRGSWTTHRRARRLRCWLAACASCALVAVAAPPASAAGPAWTGGLELELPANAYPTAPEAVLSSVACPTLGSCVGVGTYTDDAGVDRALAAGQTTGPGWRSSEIAPPANAASGHPDPSLFSVDCGAAGSCSAVGEYTVATGGVRAMVTSRANGAWSTAADVELPANASVTPEASLSSVACGAAGSCAAIGFYKDAAGDYLPMGAVEANGAWSPAAEIDLPANAATTSPEATLLSVACGGSGSCAAVGSYKDATGAFRPMGAVLAGGSWSAAVQIDLPANADATAPDAYLSALACPSVGACVAGGSYRDTTGAAHAIVASLGNGSWSTPAVLPIPADANATAPAASVDAIACGGVGSCAAAGSYADAGGTSRTMVASQIPGSWGAATRLALPANADPASPGASENSISCGAAGACVLVASYIDAAGAQRPMTAAQTGGSWAAASAMPLPGSAHATNPDAFPASVACVEQWYCIAVGSYNDKWGSRRALLGTGYPSDLPVQPADTATPAATLAPITTTPSAALRPVVALKTARFAVAKGAIKVRLGCQTARCSGTVKLTTTAKGKSILLAKASFALARGATKTISVRLTKAGKKALKHSRARAVQAKLVVSVKGARAISRTVAVR